MVAIGDENFRLLNLEARDRGITIQELIRAVVVPDWVRSNDLHGARRKNSVGQLFPSVGKENEMPPILSRPVH